MREEMTHERLRELMREIARTAPRQGTWRVYLVGGATAVLSGWRASSVDADHYDPYAQVLTKIVRGFERDLDDARHFVRSGMVDPERLRALVATIPQAEYARYPALSPSAVEEAVDAFLREANTS